MTEATNEALAAPVYEDPLPPPIEALPEQLCVGLWEPAPDQPTDGLGRFRPAPPPLAQPVEASAPEET
jgi:hypothetical protein